MRNVIGCIWSTPSLHHLYKEGWLHYRIFLSSVNIALLLVFFKVMNLVLVLVITVVAGPQAKVRQTETMRGANGVLGKRDCAAEILVENVEDGACNIVFLLLRDIFAGDVL